MKDEKLLEKAKEIIDRYQEQVYDIDIFSPEFEIEDDEDSMIWDLRNFILGEGAYFFKDYIDYIKTCTETL